MTNHRLSQKEKELIAVGISVSAGCIKCSNYHFKQAFEEGATQDEVHQAVLAANDVIASSDEILLRNAYRLMGLTREEQPDIKAEPEDILIALIQIGAAVAANNEPNSKKYISIAQSLGASSSEIHLAIKMAKHILERAGEFADEAIAEALHEEEAAI